MDKKARVRIVLIFLAFFEWAFVVACTRTIEHGEFKFLRIGSSKREIIDSVSLAGFPQIQPTLENILSTRTVSDLTLLYDSPGIKLTDNQGVAINISFEGDRVSKLSYSVPAKKFEDKFFRMGQARKDVFATMKDLIEPNFMHLVVFNFLPNRRPVYLNGANEKEINYLLEHDAWEFAGIKEYSHYTLVFRNEVLVKIVYQWSPIELP